MGTKQVTFSDLSGQLLAEHDEPVRLVVLEHPDLSGGPVQLEALPSEVAPAIDAALAVAIFEVHVPGEAVPQRIVVDVSDFDALSTGRPMRELLKAAPALASGRRTHNGQSIRYDTMQHAGTPHRGKVTPEEARLVREHLAQVNARLAGDGLRQINPANPADAERYGFATLAQGFRPEPEDA